MSNLLLLVTSVLGPVVILKGFTQPVVCNCYLVKALSYLYLSWNTDGLFWVAVQSVKELKLSYYTPEILFTIYPYYGNSS